MANSNGFESVIGLEVHAQLLTDSKIFCGCKNSFGEPPNSLTCPVCQGLPGALPLLNRDVVEFAMRVILAVGGKISNRSVFARKNYFYPDLPKGYQISQFDRPIGEGGNVSYTLKDGEQKICRLIRIHIEEDAGKSLHPEHGESYTRVDLNRCGAPLIEIVSEPDIATPEEAHAYLLKLKQTLQYLRVCSGDMEKGHLRCDANVSVRPAGSSVLGTRTEVKNMNSFKGVERALTFEIERQIALIKSGGEVQQATLLWNEKKQTVEMMRSKEESHDYRYFPEPDLVNLLISDEWIESTGKALPELPDAKQSRFIEEYSIRPYDVAVLTGNRELADYFESVMSEFDDGRAASNWIQTELLRLLNENKIEVQSAKVTPSMLADLLKRTKAGELSGKMAKDLFAEMFKTGESAATVIEKRGLVMLSDEDSLTPLLAQIVEANKENVQKYRSGKTKLLGFFVGEAMKVTKGQANPQVVNKLLKEMLDGQAD